MLLRGLFSLALLSAAWGATCEEPIPINLQLKWVQQPQFGGYIAAEEMGFYDEECLDLIIRPGGINIDPFEEVWTNRSHFGIGWTTQLLSQRARGRDLVLLSQIYRRVGMQEIQWRDAQIESPADLEGKHVCIWRGEELNVRALLHKYNLTWDEDWRFNITRPSNASIDIVEQPFHMKDFTDRKTGPGEKRCDSAAACTYNELAAVLMTKKPDGSLIRMDELSFIDFEKEGVASMEDGIFASSKWLAEGNNRDIAIRFLRASFKGWMWVRDHPEDAANLFAQKGPLFRWQTNEVNKLIWPAEEGIGLINKSLLAQTAATAFHFGVVQRQMDVSEFYMESLAQEAQQNITKFGKGWGSTHYGPGSKDIQALNYKPVNLVFCLQSGEVSLCTPDMSEGVDNWIKSDSALGVVVILVALLAGLFLLTLAVLLFKFREHYVIKTASVNMCMLMCFGGLLGVFAIFASLDEPSKGSCIVRHWLLGYAFIFFFGPFLLKTWRIHRIFNNTRFVTTKMPDGRLFKNLAVLFVIETILLLVQTILGDTRVETRPDPDEFNRLNTECVVDDDSTWLLLLYLFKVILVLYGVYLAMAVKDVHSDFNEAKYLGFSIYNLSVCAIVALPLTLGAVDMSRAGVAAVSAFAIVIVVTLSLGLLLLPKFFIIRNYEEYKRANRDKSKGYSGSSRSDAMLSTRDSDFAARVKEATNDELEKRQKQIDEMVGILGKERQAIDRELRARNKHAEKKAQANANAQAKAEEAGGGPRVHTEPLASGPMSEIEEVVIQDPTDT